MINMDYARADELLWAIKVRILTPEEMREVRAIGHQLIVRNGVPYFEADIKAEFNALLIGQFNMRLLQEEHEERMGRR